MDSLFKNGLGSDPMYRKCRDDFSLRHKEAKKFIDSLWETYQPCADKDFKMKIGEDFIARFWEMYLTCVLLEHGLGVKPRKEHPNKGGPDVLVEMNGRRIWLEATAPTKGKRGCNDTVPENQVWDGQGIPVVNSVPHEKIILRYRGSIQEKFKKQGSQYLEGRKKGLIEEQDCYVVAINGCQVSSVADESDFPGIVKAVLPIGDLQVRMDRKTLEFSEPEHQYRDSIPKSSGESVSTSIFLDPDYECLSAVLFSLAHPVDPENISKKRGHDFILVHNPLARNPLPRDLFKFCRQYGAEIKEDSFAIYRIGDQ